MGCIVEACAECTQNCILIHKKSKDPWPVTTTFFRVMFGDNFSEVMFIPPKFARSVQHLVGTETRLEDSSGEKWTVKLTQVDGLLAFQDGWNEFLTDHSLKLGDFVVFHYIRGSHFVVTMYGQSGCPERRHFGRHHHSSEPVNGRRHSNTSRFRSGSSDYGVNEFRGIREFSKYKEKRMRKDGKFVANGNSPSDMNVNGTSSRSKDKEIHRSPGPLISDKSPCFGNESEKVNMEPVTMIVPDGPSPSLVESFAMVVPKVHSPCHVEPFFWVDRDTGKLEEENRRSCLRDLSSFEIFGNQSGGQGSNDSKVGGGRGGGYEHREYGSGLIDLPPKVEKNGNVLETRVETAAANRKESEAKPNEAACHGSNKTRLRTASPPPIKKTGTAKKELGGTSGNDVVKILPAKMMKTVKKELVTGATSDKYDPVEGRLGHKSKDTNRDGFSPLISPKKEFDTPPDIKIESIDFDDEPPPYFANTTFSVVMESYRYLELPRDFELRSIRRGRVRSKVFFLKGVGDSRFRPVSYQTVCGSKGLIRGWKEFARANGVRPGDKCEFVLLEDEPESLFEVRVVHS